MHLTFEETWLSPGSNLRSNLAGGVVDSSLPQTCLLYRWVPCLGWSPEKLLEVNIHIFGCNKKFNSKKIIRKSKSDFDKDLDLLLIDDIKHYILIKNINKFVSDNSHVIKTCRNCLNVFYSEIKYKDHIEYCKFRKAKKLMPSFKKYMKFENLKNCILNNWIIHSDFECTIDPITKEHEFIAGGYYLECRNNKFSKKVQTFYNLKEYTISLVKELIYISMI